MTTMIKLNGYVAVLLDISPVDIDRDFYRSPVYFHPQQVADHLRDDVSDIVNILSSMNAHIFRDKKCECPDVRRQLILDDINQMANLVRTTFSQEEPGNVFLMSRQTGSDHCEQCGINEYGQSGIEYWIEPIDVMFDADDVQIPRLP